ncbi:MAG: 30S ribosomal protein S5 [Candidatus Nanohaloarchaea archaeon]|nr:30S ribosomal protein S5 [Candidatus Nanohaloarchaea archaeon]
MAEQDEDDTVWKPKTELGRLVKQGKIDDIHEALRHENPLREPEIIDQLVPNLEEEVILIGGTPGKGGGKKRIVSKRTVRMHKSGRRFKTKAMVVIGNENGLIGLAEGYSDDTRDAIDKARENAKLNLIEVRRGNGSWEDRGTEPTTIPFKAEGKSGSVEVELKPAPKGTGLAASDEVKKLLRLAGIQDLWIKSRGNTRSRENHLKALFNAFKNMNQDDVRERTGLVRGVV